LDSTGFEPVHLVCATRPRVPRRSSLACRPRATGGPCASRRRSSPEHRRGRSRAVKYRQLTSASVFIRDHVASPIGDRRGRHFRNRMAPRIRAASAGVGSEKSRKPPSSSPSWTTVFKSSRRLIADKCRWIYRRTSCHRSPYGSRRPGRRSPTIRIRRSATAREPHQARRAVAPAVSCLEDIFGWLYA
jgi:hypothetical protein